MSTPPTMNGIASREEHNTAARLLSISRNPRGPPGAAIRRVVVRLARGRSAFGRVIDGEDRPVAGAEVTLTVPGAQPLPPGATAEGSEHRGTSDAEGRFIVPNPGDSRIPTAAAGSRSS